MDVPGIHCLSGKFSFISTMRDVTMYVISTWEHVGIFLLLCPFLLCHCLTSTIFQSSVIITLYNVDCYNLQCVVNLLNPALKFNAFWVLC